MVLNLIGEVIDSKELITEIENAQEDIELIINSPGGSVFEGLQIINAIQKSEHKVTAKVEVMSASVAAVITLACDNFTIAKGDLMLLHNCWTMAIGNKEELREEADAMEQFDKVLHGFITEHCTNAEEVEKRMNSGDYWLTGEEVAETFEHCELVDRVNPKKGEKAALDFGNLAAMVKEYKELKMQRERIEELDQYIATERLKELLAYDE